MSVNTSKYVVFFFEALEKRSLAVLPVAVVKVLPISIPVNLSCSNLTRLPLFFSQRVCKIASYHLAQSSFVYTETMNGLL